MCFGSESGVPVADSLKREKQQAPQKENWPPEDRSQRAEPGATEEREDFCLFASTQCNNDLTRNLQNRL